MPLVEFKELTDAQKAEVFAMYPPPWSAGSYEWYRFWIKPDGHLTRQRGRHEMTEQGYDAWKKLAFEPPPPRPEKGDLAAWKPGHTFHFLRD